MKYRKLKGYKYQTLEPYTYTLPRAFSGQMANLPYIILVDRKLFIKKGYAWDGPSGPTFDTDTFMRGSLVHDALYNLLRTKDLRPQLRFQVDIVLRDICREDGMCRFRAWYVYKGVRLFGGSRARNGVENYDKIYETKGE